MFDLVDKIIMKLITFGMITIKTNYSSNVMHENWFMVNEKKFPNLGIPRWQYYLVCPTN